MVVGGAGLTYAHPLLLTFLLIAFCGLGTRRRKLLAAGLIGIFLTAWPPAAWVAGMPLEHWYPIQPPQTDGAQAIVVLAAGINGDRESPGGPWLKDNTAARCHYGAWLWKRSNGLPVLLCGGPVPIPPPASKVMRQAMIGQGVPESLLWTEERSTSTYENARNGAEILRAKGIRRIVLVTEAYHMLRSERCFRKQGLEVIPAPCAFNDLPRSANSWLPGPEGVFANEQTLHEFVGLGWYLVSGRI